MAQEKVRERTDGKVRDWKPELYEVVMHNDDVTTMDFVVEVLIEIFFHDFMKAYELMMRIHHKGEAIVGCYEYDIAVSKVRKVRMLAQAAGFPLKVSLRKQH